MVWLKKYAVVEMTVKNYFIVGNMIEIRDAKGYSSMLVRIKTYKWCVVIYVVWKEPYYRQLGKSVAFD